MSRFIDRTSSVPLHSQIKQILIAEIEDTEAATPILTEAGLIKRFNVSRAPIRQALKDLADEGYVVRHRAKGTFPVRGLNVRLPSAVELGGLSRYLAEQGFRPTSRITGLERVETPEEVRQALGPQTPDEVLYLKRVIHVDGSPLVCTYTYLCTPPEFMPDVGELERTGTVFVLIDQKLGLKFRHGEQNIWASGATAEEAETLCVEVGSPVLVAVTTMFTTEGRPGGWRRAVHRAEDFKYAFGVSR